MNLLSIAKQIFDRLKAKDIFQDFESARCPEEHPYLKGWKTCLDCQWLQAVAKQEVIEKQIPARFALFSTSGIEQGKVIFIRKGLEVLGTHEQSDHAVTITLNAKRKQRRTSRPPELHLSMHGNCLRILAPTNEIFFINGQCRKRERVTDYDFLHFMGSEWMIFNLQGESYEYQKEL